MFRFSQVARADLNAIAIFSKQTWGEEQAIKYVRQLLSFCERLAADPMMGRAFGPEKPRTLRMEHGSHVVFYRKDGGGIFVQRILHKHMSPLNYL